MLQTLLAERFQLKFHRETRELPAYNLLVGDNRAKLKPSAPDSESRTVRIGRSRMNYFNVTISELVLQIATQFDRPLLDKTGLQGGYDFALEYMPSLPSTVTCRRSRRPRLLNSIQPMQRHRCQWPFNNSLD
jgi:uncharacterized protein (TIGR03435 family)